MTKTWEQMDQAEKIEELRKDVLKTMATVNEWIRSQQQLGGAHHSLQSKHSATSHTLSEVADAVKVLETKVAKLEK